METKRNRESAVALQDLGEQDVARAVKAMFPTMKLRREPRFPFSFPIQVAGMDREKNIFQVSTATVDISRSGCRFTMQTAVMPGAFLALETDHGEAGASPLTALYSVVWCRPVGDAYEVGALLLDGPNLWNITFPDQITGAW